MQQNYSFLRWNFYKSFFAIETFQHEANDKARNFNIQNEDAQNEKTTIDEQIRENKFSEISDERKGTKT